MDQLSDNKIVAFYHVFQSLGWEQMFLQQINALFLSGLYDELKAIYVCINGNEPLPIETSKMIVHRNKNFDVEADTLFRMWKFSTENKIHKLLYFHTKGLSYECTPQRKNEESWRLYLEYYTIHNWKTCIELLETYDCVGTEWTEKKKIYYHKSKIDAIDIKDSSKYLYFYAGNFWWANSDYISSLDPNYLYNFKADFENNDIDIYKIEGFDESKERMIMRMNSETWIGTNGPKHFNFKKIKNNPLEFYHNCDFFSQEIIEINQKKISKLSYE